MRTARRYARSAKVPIGTAREYDQLPKNQRVIGTDRNEYEVFVVQVTSMYEDGEETASAERCDREKIGETVGRIAADHQKRFGVPKKIVSKVVPDENIGEL